MAAWNPRDFRARLERRAKRVGLQKNACVALGNLREESGVPALVSALETGELLVRGHAAWALGQIATPEAMEALERILTSESDPYVREETDAAVLAARQGVPNETESVS